ncbi:unnamed protein product [Amoebophrya sp. A25]|nr:unnamed protein product [Amoebophrya sp. A25]|eukprot:GSA25T00019189001.1
MQQCEHEGSWSDLLVSTNNTIDARRAPVLVDGNKFDTTSMNNNMMNNNVNNNMMNNNMMNNNMNNNVMNNATSDTIKNASNNTISQFDLLREVFEEYVIKYYNYQSSAITSSVCGRSPSASVAGGGAGKTELEVASFFPPGFTFLFELRHPLLPSIIPSSRRSSSGNALKSFDGTKDGGGGLTFLGARRNEAPYEFLPASLSTASILTSGGSTSSFSAGAAAAAAADTLSKICTLFPTALHSALLRPSHDIMMFHCQHLNWRRGTAVPRFIDRLHFCEQLTKQ